MLELANSTKIHNRLVREIKNYPSLNAADRQFLFDNLFLYFMAVEEETTEKVTKKFAGFINPFTGEKVGE